MIEIAPSILTSDFFNLEKTLHQLESNNIKYLHLDIMDGHFVPNITFGPSIVKQIHQKTSLLLDVHLMIKNPQDYIDTFIDSGAKIITVHQEACVHLHSVLYQIKNKNCLCGVAINPATPLCVLDEVLHIVDVVVIMSVNPGFGGQKFIPSVLNKIQKLKSIAKNKNYNFLIEIDGGVNKENIVELVQSGCNLIVVGNSIFNIHKSIEENITQLTTLISNH